MLLKAAIKHLRLRPFDVSTEEGRSAERYRLASWSVMTEVLSRIGGLVLMVMSIRWAAPYLGPERFGAWALFVSLPLLLAFLDMGLANAMTNRVAHTMRAGGREAATSSVSSGLLILCGIASVQGAALFVVATVMPWESVLRLQDASLEAEIRLAAQVLAAVSSLMLLSNGVGRVLYGLQRAYMVHVANAMGSVCALAALYIAISKQADMATLIACQLLPATLITGALIAPLSRSGLISATHAVSALRAEGPLLIRSGALFFVLQLGTTIGWSADAAILATTAGAVSVGVFSVTARLFQLISQPLTVINSPLWAAYADAHAAGDARFIRLAFRRSVSATFLLALLGASLCVVLGQDAVQLWTSNSIAPSHQLLAVLAVWTVLECCGTSLAMLLNGLSIIRQQVFTAVLFIALAIPTKIVLCSLYGAVGLVFGSIVSYVAAIFIGYGLLFREEILSAIQGSPRKCRT
jgi:O-antigen/teichoic acid export membrane protein